MRHLPAGLLVLLPLGALAWLGSAELARETERAERLLTEQAQAFVSDADTALRTAIDRRVGELDAHLAAIENLPVEPTLGLVGPARATRHLAVRDPLILDLVVLDAEGDLVYPTESPNEATTLPFSRASRATRSAETLETLGDVDGARELLQEVVAEGDNLRQRSPTSDALLRAHFALGGLERKREAFDLAEGHYLNAAAEVRRLTARGDLDPELPTILLLTETAFAEIQLARGRGGQPAIDLALDIADGFRDRCGDKLLEAVFDRLERAAPAEPATLEELREIRESDVVRQRGRKFAREYSDKLVETMKRRLSRAGDSTIRQVFAGADGNSLLLLRPVAENTFEGSRLGELEHCRWVGLRIDLDRLLVEAVGTMVAGLDSFALSVVDAEGTSLVPLDPSLTGTQRSATRTTSAGLGLAAVPLDFRKALAERRDSIRNRALLLILLSATAVFGAWFLARSLRREAELAKLKVSLVSRVTHDLKTPLALIRMYAETLERGRARSPEESARFAGIVAREADGLARAVDRILDFSRSQAGTLQYAREEADLAELAARAVETSRPTAQARALSLRTDLAEGVIVEVDPAATISALRDLLENAGKYARPAGSGVARFVVVRVRVDRASREAILEVEDDGIGIPTDERHRVFESFYRASNAGEVRGTGLGLALVKHFVDAHDGRVEILARNGGGTIVQIRLPLPRTAGQPS